MRIQTFIALATVLAGLTLSGCNSPESAGGYKPAPEDKVPPATIVPGQEAELFPAEVGNTWVYEGSSEQTGPTGQKSSTSEVTFRVTKVVDTPEGKNVSLDIMSDGALADRIVWRIGKNGIYEISGTDRKAANAPLVSVKYEPPTPECPFPVTAGKTAKATSIGVRPGAGVGPFKVQVTVLGVQEVDTAMGRFSAVCTASEQSYQRDKVQFRSSTTSFWAPKVGIVRYVQEVVAVNDKNQSIASTSVLRLKSHQP